MKSIPVFVAALFVFVSSVSSQTLTNDTIRERIWNTKAEKSITLTYDPAAKTSKVMAESENFSKSEASRSGLLAMNFAMGFFYPGEELSKSPDPILFTFWVLTKKPRFGENHAMTAALREEMLVIGSARYISKPAQQMEYLNFEMSRENLAKIASESNVRFHLGDQEFTFTKGQMKLIADMLAITEVH